MKMEAHEIAAMPVMIVAMRTEYGGIQGRDALRVTHFDAWSTGIGFRGRFGCQRKKGLTRSECILYIKTFKFNGEEARAC